MQLNCCIVLKRIPRKIQQHYDINWEDLDIWGQFKHKTENKIISVHYDVSGSLSKQHLMIVTAGSNFLA